MVTHLDPEHVQVGLESANDSWSCRWKPGGRGRELAETALSLNFTLPSDVPPIIGEAYYLTVEQLVEFGAVGLHRDSNLTFRLTSAHLEILRESTLVVTQVWRNVYRLVYTAVIKFTEVGVSYILRMLWQQTRSPDPGHAQTTPVGFPYATARLERPLIEPDNVQMSLHGGTLYMIGDAVHHAEK